MRFSFSMVRAIFALRRSERHWSLRHRDPSDVGNHPTAAAQRATVGGTRAIGKCTNTPPSRRPFPEAPGPVRSSRFHAMRTLLVTGFDGPDELVVAEQPKPGHAVDDGRDQIVIEVMRWPAGG